MGALAKITTKLVWLHSLVEDMGVPFLIVTLNYCETQNDVFNEQKNHILSLHWSFPMMSSSLSWSFPTSTCFF